MKTLELKSALRTAASKNAAAPEELLSLCRRGYCSHPRPRRAGRRELVRSQMRFTALPVWALQGALLIFICLVLSAAAPNEDLVPACASISAELAALTLLPFCNRAARFGMRESRPPRASTHRTHARAARRGRHGRRCVRLRDRAAQRRRGGEVLSSS